MSAIFSCLSYHSFTPIDADIQKIIIIFSYENNFQLRP